MSAKRLPSEGASVCGPTHRVSLLRPGFSVLSSEPRREQPGVRGQARCRSLVGLYPLGLVSKISHMPARSGSR